MGGEVMVQVLSFMKKLETEKSAVLCKPYRYVNILIQLVYLMFIICICSVNSFFHFFP